MEQKYTGIFNDSFPPIIDGVTLTVENYVSYLTAKGHSPCVVTPWNPVRVKTDYPIMRYFSLPIWNRHPYRYGYPKLDPLIWGRVARTPFKLIHAHCPFSSGRLGVYACKKQHVPLVATFHSKYKSDLQHSFRSTPWMVPIIMGRILDFFNAADHVWIPQAKVEETIREYGYKGPVTVVENGNDFASMPDGQVSDYRRESRKALGIPDNAYSLLFVGQHIRAKGVEMIAHALNGLNPDIDFRMHFIGTGYLLDELKKYVEETPQLASRCTVNGMITDREKLKQHYAAADLFIFPSLYDNAPLVVREAAAMRTPALLLKDSTASEVITDGKNGFLCGNSESELREALESLYRHRDKLSAAGQNARHSLVRSWQDVVDEVDQRYTDILNAYNRKYK